MNVQQVQHRWRVALVAALILSGPAWLGLAQAGSTLDLANQSVDFKVVARDGDDRLGSAKTIATGDFNNDGTTDFLLGVPGGDGPNDRRQNIGEAYIIFGRSDLPSSFNVDGIPGPDVVIYGQDLGDRLGSTTAAGDVNGDGIDDVILSAPNANGSANNRDDVGEVVVLNGQSSWPDEIDLGNTSPDLIVYNNRQQSSFGASMITNDLNGDAIPDLVLGDPAASGSTGAAYVINGRQDMPDRLDIARPDDVNVTIQGADTGDRLGQSLAGADVNGDGIGDLIVSAPRADAAQNDRPDSGSAFVVLGRSDLPGTIDLGQTSPDATIFGAGNQNRLGASLDVGDLNGDGLPDIAVGAPGAGGPNTQQGGAGSVHVIYGSQSLQSLYDMDAGDQDVRINGAQALENAGESLALSDLDQDGQLDLIIGAPGGSGPGGERAQSGTVYVVRNDNGFSSQLRLSSGADLAVYGANGGDTLGASLDAGAVTNGNEGVLLMGAPGVDSQVNGPDAGIVYLLRAGPMIQPNRAPTASAGSDRTVTVGTEVQLDGSGSSDPEGGELSFAWTLTSRPSDSSASLSGANTAQPTFTPDVAGEYVVELTVEDGQGATSTDSVRITAQTEGDGEPSGDNPGDLDGDGDVTILDARIVCEAVLGDRSLSESERGLADVAPPEGEITLKDAQWIADAAVGRRSLSAPAESSNGSSIQSLKLLALNVLSQRNGGLAVRATGLGIDAVRLGVYNLNGQTAYQSGWNDGSRLSWSGMTDRGRQLANGVYLAAVSVRGEDGTLHREIRKVVILR